MLMRDFGFNIYRAIAEAPEKTKEEKSRDEKEKDKSKDDKDKTKDDKVATQGLLPLNPLLKIKWFVTAFQSIGDINPSMPLFRIRRVKRTRRKIPSRRIKIRKVTLIEKMEIRKIKMKIWILNLAQKIRTT